MTDQPSPEVMNQAKAAGLRRGDSFSYSNDAIAAAENHPDDAVMKRPDLDAIQTRADAASPGPWYYDDSTGQFEVWNELENVMILGDSANGYEGPSETNARFIASARTDVPALLAALATERARADQAAIAVWWEGYRACLGDFDGPRQRMTPNPYESAAPTAEQ